MDHNNGRANLVNEGIILSCLKDTGKFVDKLRKCYVLNKISATCIWLAAGTSLDAGCH